MFSSLLKYIWVHLPSLRGLFYRPSKKTYLFLPINGAGLGHLTRSLAVARRLQELQPEAEIVFLTTSIGVTLVHRAGFVCHHVTPAALLNTDSVVWNKLFFDSIESVLKVHKPSTFVFDGTIPYLGLQRVMHAYKRIDYIWVKRGLYKEGVDRERVSRLAAGFKRIVSPGELVAEKVSELDNERFYTVEPISLLDKSDLLDRDLARRLLRLDLVKPCAYVQLGAGNINGIADAQNRLIALLQRRGVQIVLGQSPIALNPEPNLTADSVIVDYPNSKYFAAFDFAVLAGGYNSVCEAVILGLPAIFLPNIATGADDQVKRARQACAFGHYEVLVEFDEPAFDEAVDRLLTRDNRVAEYPRQNGAVTTAELVERA